MEGTMAEIRGFAGTFAPRQCAYCDGQLLAISQYQALFSLLGTTYGGDGRTTFALPDLRGRALLHKGTRPGGQARQLGESGGIEQVQLNVNEIPAHKHNASSQGGSGALTGAATAKMNVNNGAGDSPDPLNNYLGVEGGGSGLYASAKDAASTLNGDAISVDTSGLNVAISGITVTTDNIGGSNAHTNMQPYLVCSWIICLDGVYPSRN